MPTITEIVETDSEAHDVRRAPQGVSPEEHRLARRMFLADVSDDDEGEVSRVYTTLTVIIYKQLTSAVAVRYRTATSRRHRRTR